jgi:hypothetical protein
MSNLKSLHPYLHRRIRLKGIVHVLLGLAILLSLTGVSARTGLARYVPYEFWGVVFLAIGLGILYNLWKDKRKLTRAWLKIAFYYAALWFLSLVVGVIFTGLSGLSIVILWGYLTYNLWYISKDTGWEGAVLLKEIKEQIDAR